MLKVYVYDARSGTSPIQRLAVHQGLGRESRVLFCGDRLLSSGFTSKRAQEIHVLEVGKWDKPIHTQEYVSATGVLMPFYDPDTKLVFLILCFQWHPMASDLLAVALSDNSIEIWESKTLTRKRRILSHTAAVMALGWSSDGHRLASIGKDLMLNVHQPQLGDECMVAQKKKDVFQSDLFPDALVTWRPVMTAEEWLAGSLKTPQFESLMPQGVSALARPPVVAAPARSLEKPSLPVSEHTRESKVQNSWSSKIVEDRTLEQDDMEGVSEEEWTEAL
ncbi:hypothetical protein GCK32_008181 [Trichostrongylus colubriformis]|uniref:Coronin-7 n=1 Tax=Trichostrongylus colubriformis TaxID=6319 RepID=A0AAN8FV94_TRICO